VAWGLFLACVVWGMGYGVCGMVWGLGGYVTWYGIIMYVYIIIVSPLTQTCLDLLSPVANNLYFKIYNSQPTCLELLRFAESSMESASSITHQASSVKHQHQTQTQVSIIN
jgi:hypothetical protein